MYTVCPEIQRIISHFYTFIDKFSMDFSLAVINSPLNNIQHSQLMLETFLIQYLQ